jgi:Putative DNA-binding domain
MSDLANFQNTFENALAQGDGVIGPMTVYRNTSLYGAVEALRANYPVVETIVGISMFDGIAAEYAEECPPRSPVLADYGRGFADWIEHQRWSADIPYLSDVARFERLHIEALFAADAAPLSPDAIANIDPEAWTQIVLRLHPATRFDWATTPAMAIWLAHQGDGPLNIEAEWKSVGGLFVRPFGQVVARTLDSAAHRFLFGIRLGEPIGTAALAATSLYPHADIGGLFASLLACGAFAALNTPERLVP